MRSHGETRHESAKPLDVTYLISKARRSCIVPYQIPCICVIPLSLSTLLVYPRGKVEHLFKANETCSVLRAVHQPPPPVSEKPGLVLGVWRQLDFFSCIAPPLRSFPSGNEKCTGLWLREEATSLFLSQHLRTPFLGRNA